MNYPQVSGKQSLFLFQGGNIYGSTAQSSGNEF